MSPYEEIRQLYDSHTHGWTFGDYLSWYSANGYVYACPEYFVMGRPVPSDEHPSVICSPKVFTNILCDAWYIHAMAGDLGKVWEVLPFDLPMIAFDRQLGRTVRKDLRFLPLAALRRHCTQTQNVLSFSIKP